MRALIVGDHESVRLALGLALQLAGFEVIAFAEGEKALDSLRADAGVSVIICSSGLADMTGVDLVRALRSEGLTIPIVFLTGPTNGKIAARPADVNAVVFKPFTFPDLKQAIWRAIGTRPP
jgi:two-component system response regulator ChvI